MSYSTKKAFSLWTVIPYLDALEKIVTLDWVQAFSENWIWSPTCLMEKNHHILNDLIIRYHEATRSDWVPADWSTLESIAKQCPNMGGNAVFEARTILKGLTETEGIYETVCDYLHPQAVNKKSTATEASSNTIEFQVYPNPARDQITLVVKGNETTPDWVRIHNLNGQLVLKRNWTQDSQEEIINTSDFEAGIYFITIGNETTTLHHQKLIILR